MGSEDAERWARSDRSSRSSLYISSITHLTIHRPADSPIYTRTPARSFISFHLSRVHPSPHPSCHHPSRSQHSLPFLQSLKPSVYPHIHHHHQQPGLLCWWMGGGGGTVSGDQQSITASKQRELTRVLLLDAQQNTAHAQTPGNITELARGGFSILNLSAM